MKQKMTKSELKLYYTIACRDISTLAAVGSGSKNALSWTMGGCLGAHCLGALQICPTGARYSENWSHLSPFSSIDKDGIAWYRRMVYT